MKNLFKDAKDYYVESWKLTKKHWKGIIFLSAITSIFSFGPLIVSLIKDKINKKKFSKEHNEG